MFKVLLDKEGNWFFRLDYRCEVGFLSRTQFVEKMEKEESKTLKVNVELFASFAGRE